MLTGDTCPWSVHGKELAADTAEYHIAGQRRVPRRATFNEVCRLMFTNIKNVSLKEIGRAHV